MAPQLLDPISVRPAQRADGPVCVIAGTVDWSLDLGPLQSDVRRHAEKLLRVTAQSWGQSLPGSRTEASGAVTRSARQPQRSFQQSPTWALRYHGLAS